MRIAALLRSCIIGFVCVGHVDMAFRGSSKTGKSKSSKGDDSRHRQRDRTTHRRPRLPQPKPAPHPHGLGPDTIISGGMTYHRRPPPGLSTNPPVSPTIPPSTSKPCTTDADCDDQDACSQSLCTVEGRCETNSVLCDDANLCTTDSCDPVTGCSFQPTVACPPGESCDRLDGTCKSNNDLRPCIAVIDESSKADLFINTTWAAFRSEFPNRPFCLLQPQIPPTSNNKLYRPDSFTADPRNIFSLVARDNGNLNQASDWGTICEIYDLTTTGIDYVGLFVDQSGSMRLSTVRASYDKFLQDLTNANLTFRTLLNGVEDWITPFRTVLN